MGKKNVNPPSKDDLFWKILDSVVRLECTKGHLKWRMTDLSRSSGVTRSLIYYYFGRSKPDLVRTAITILGEEFFGLDPSRHQLWEQGRFAESVRLTRDLFKKAPYMGVFYLTQRQPGAVFYDEIMALESRYLKRLSKSNPGASMAQIQLLFSMLFGVVVFHDFPDSVLDAIKLF